MKKVLFALMALFIAELSQAELHLPRIFGDNMVLQRNVKIPIWGTASAGEKVLVRFHQQVKTVQADAAGKWTVWLSPEKAGGPYVLQVSASSTIKFSNVLVGEVWLCSGQSNMELVVATAQNATAEIAAAHLPQIRHIKIEKEINTLPQQDFASGNWQVCSPNTVGNFTAVGYYFAKQIYQQLKVPVGLIHSSWGGTNIETWISREAFENSEEFKTMIAGMPVLNLDSMAAVRQEAVIRNIEKLQGAPLAKENSAAFKDANFNDSKWPEMLVPAQWESQAPGEIDGVVWLRKTIELTPEQAGKTATLHLSMIDDDDETYVNGTAVGATKGYNVMRAYALPKGLLKPGTNSIVVRVVDNGGGGGIYGKEDDVKLQLGNENFSLAGKWKYQVESLLLALNVNGYPSLAYNAMINSIIPYAIKGVLWYQGETNAGRAAQYETAFPLMIKDWRSRWKNDFPFYFVQLATYTTAGNNSNEGSDWAELREAQLRTLSLQHTGMAVTTDIGTPDDIHPRNKQDVGKRLAAIALNNLYGKPQEYSGPMFKALTVKQHLATLTFTHSGKGLVAKPAKADLLGFEIAGADKVFYPATAMIINNSVVVQSPKAPEPVAVRYGWKGNDELINLFNKDGFPASPFRTDNWKRITEEVKYIIVK